MIRLLANVWSNVKYCLWLLAEVAVIAADIPEVIGTTFALNILFHIPLWAEVLLTGCITILLLSLQRFGAELLLELLKEQLLNWIFNCMVELHASLASLIKL